MIKLVIIDDEEDVREVIKKMISLLNFDIEIVGEASSIVNAKNIIETKQPEIVLLDIELEDGSGFDLLNTLSNYNFQLIFITAFNEFAIKAFKFNALDYILKPIDPEELEQAILKSKEAINSKNQLESLLKNVDYNKKNFEKIVIKTTQQTHIINIKDIYYIQSNRAYSSLFLKNKSIFTSKNLKFFVDILPKEIFIRTHKSYLVNKNYIKGIEHDKLILGNNYKVLVSVRKIAEIKKNNRLY